MMPPIGIERATPAEAFQVGVDAATKDIWDEISAAIPRGRLSGNGMDETAHANGMIHASNLIAFRIWGRPKPGEL